jgi:hypothetical protein
VDLVIITAAVIATVARLAWVMTRPAYRAAIGDLRARREAREAATARHLDEMARLRADVAQREAEVAALERRNAIGEAFVIEGRAVGRFDDTVALAAAERSGASFEEVFAVADELRARSQRYRRQ